jgi:hypothetical protein
MFKKILPVLGIVFILGSVLTACTGEKSDQAALDKLNELNRQARLLINQPGWLHLKEEVVFDTDKENRGTLSNGTVVPLEHFIDSWYHINQEKKVYQYVWELSNLDGEVIQTMVFKDNLLNDLTSNGSQGMNPYSLDSLDFNFDDELSRYIANQWGHPKVTTSELDGKAVTVFTLNTTLGEAEISEDFTQPIKRVLSIFTYDSSSGLLIKLERTVTLQDGTKRTYHTEVLKVETGVEPPESVINYVNGIW